MAQIGSVWGTHTWVVSGGWAAHTWKDASTPSVVIIPPSPTRLAIAITNTTLAFETIEPGQLSYAIVTNELRWPLTGSQLAFPSLGNQLGFLGEDGFPMATPVQFTAGSTGPLTLTCEGADGTPEDLSTASSVTLRVVSTAGTVVVNAVALTSLTAAGTAVWTRTAPQTATATDYRSQVKVVRADATIGFFPDNQVGTPITMLPAI